MEFEVITSPGPARALVPAPERCESCGTPVSVVDAIALMRAFSGLPAPEEARREWMEQRVVSNGPWSSTMQLRPHTPERCRRVRAGDPEPWTDIDEDDDDA